MSSVTRREVWVVFVLCVFALAGCKSSFCLEEQTPEESKPLNPKGPKVAVLETKDSRRHVPDDKVTGQIIGNGFYWLWWHYTTPCQDPYRNCKALQNSTANYFRASGEFSRVDTVGPSVPRGEYDLAVQPELTALHSKGLMWFLLYPPFTWLWQGVGLPNGKEQVVYGFRLTVVNPASERELWTSDEIKGETVYVEQTAYRGRDLAGKLNQYVRSDLESVLVPQLGSIAVLVDPTDVPIPPLPPIEQRWAVIIGISKYQHEGVGGLKNLDFAARDAGELYRELVETHPELWPKENVRLLTNEEATLANVNESIHGFLKQSQKNDLVLIFFSGHGAPDPTRPENNYFLCYDTDPQRMTATGFPMWGIQEAIEQNPNKQKIIEAQRVIVMADACHSGGFAPSGMKDLKIVSRSVSKGVHVLSETNMDTREDQRTYCRVITSCREGELSQERPDWNNGHGAFACALIDGLKGNADDREHKNSKANGDGTVDVEELIYYVRRQVGDMTQNAQHVQDSGRVNEAMVRRAPE